MLITQNVGDFILVHRMWLLLTDRFKIEQRRRGIIGMPPWLAPETRDEIRVILASGIPLENEMLIWDVARGWHEVELR